MWFLYQQPDELRQRFDAGRQRARMAPLKQVRRGSAPAFDAPVQRQQAAAEQPYGGQLAVERS